MRPQCTQPLTIQTQQTCTESYEGLRRAASERQKNLKALTAEEKDSIKGKGNRIEKLLKGH